MVEDWMFMRDIWGDFEYYTLEYTYYYYYYYVLIWIGDTLC